MKRAIRFDRGRLKKPTRNAAGFLRADAFVTRVGVFGYLNADGTTRRELRHPDEVFDAESLATLHLIPVTREHPAELVNDSNAAGLTVGTTGENAKRNDRFVETAIQVTDRETIAGIEGNTRRDLSCGYLCDKDETPGVTKGIPGVKDGLRYDVIQRNIRYNHVAVTERGRAGPEVSIPRLDSDGVDVDVGVMVLDSDEPRKRDPQPSGARAMETIRIDGVDYEVSKQAAQAYRKMIADGEEAAVAAKKALDKQTARADAAEESLAAEKKKLEDAKKAHDSAAGDEAIRKRVDSRVKLVTDAVAVLTAHDALNGDDGKPTDLSAMTDAEIRSHVIAKAAPSANLDGKSDDYIAVRFDHLVELAAEKPGRDAASSRQAVADAAANRGDADGDEPSAEKARAKMIADSTKAYEKPTVGVFAE
jgi:hypothetical protein